MYKIAIPTHRRSDTINKKTLKLLAGFNPADVYLFISDKEDFDKYNQSYSKYNLVLTNCETVRDKFNYIQTYFSNGTFVIVLEDDIDSIQSLVTNDLRKILNYIYNYCYTNKIKAFGVYPSSNKFFMSKTIEVGLTYIVANMFGFLSEHNSALLCNLKTKNDYERSVKYYQHYGMIARFNFISCKTNNYKNKGGMQLLDDRTQLEKEASLSLVSMYPNIFTINNKRKSGYTELKMYKNINKKTL